MELCGQPETLSRPNFGMVPTSRAEHPILQPMIDGWPIALIRKLIWK